VVVVADFKPFPDPNTNPGVQLATARGPDYICTGCGEVLPAGAWLFENVDDGMVIGITARNGGEQADIVHQCGEN
jgi:hypothetical protein